MTRMSSTVVQNRRRQLLARTALAGLGVAAALGGASPALAQMTGVGNVINTTSNGGAVGVTSGGGVTNVTTGAPRSILNWTSLNVSTSEQLNFYFNNRSDIVLNRVLGSASVDGVLNGCMATCGTTGGNVWIISSGGVVIGANARINTGGFLASTGGLTDADFLDGDMNFAFSGAADDSAVSVLSGAQINANGGAIALIAPVVNTAAGSTITGTNGSDVTYASAQNYNVTFAQTATDDLDLITFQVPSKADGAGGAPGLTLHGTTNANQVFAAIVSKTGVASEILLGGSITATAAAGENGDIVLSAGAGFSNGVPLDPTDGSDSGITQNAGSILTGTNVTLRAERAIVADRIDATGQVWLDSTWGGISQTGAITASSLWAEARAGIDLTDTGNDFDTISLLDNDSTGAISLTDADGFQITGGITNWGGIVNLTALNGSITQTGLGVIWADRLNASATGDLALGTASNWLTTLGTLTAGGAVSYRGNANFDLNGPVTAASLTLRSDTGAITQTGAPLNVGQLSVQAETGINLNRVTNQIDEITGLTSTSGDIILISNGDLSLAGNVTGAASVSLQVFSGGITQDSGIITAANFSATADSGLAFGGQNAVGQLTGLVAGGSGDIVFRNAGNLVLTGGITATGDDVTLYSTAGAITQPSGLITADRLTASAAGDISLGVSANNVNTIAGLASTSGIIDYKNAASFDIQGDVTTAADKTVVLRTANAGATITQTSGAFNVGAFSAHSNGSVTINGVNQIRRIAGISSSGHVSVSTTTDVQLSQSIYTQTLSVNSGGAITQNASTILSIGTLNLSAVTGINLPNGDPTFVNAIQNLGTITNATSGGINIVRGGAGALNLTGNITATGQAVSLTNTVGGLNQTGGIVTADTLSLSAAGAINATRNNTINGLAAVTAGGDFSFVNAGPLLLTGDITAAGQTVSLTTNSGQINQTGGIITADRLNLSAGGLISVYRPNAVTSLGTVTAGGSVAFRNGGDLVVGGDITANGSTVSLRSNSGSITQTAGSDIVSLWLEALAMTGISLTNAGNNVGNLSSLQTASGGLTFQQTNSFSIGAPITADGQTVSLTSLNGSITQAVFTGISADRLNASAAGNVTLGGPNNVGSLGVISSGGLFTYRDVDSFDLTGDITATTGVSLTAQNGGSINQTGGIITTGDITADAGGDLTLGGLNQVTSISALTAGGDLLYRQVGDLAAPAITAAGTVSLYSTTGDITQTGAITADTLVLGAGDDIVLGQNFIAKLGQVDAGGDFTAMNALGLSSGALELTDDITVGGAMMLAHTDDITQTGGAITAGSLTLNSMGALDLAGGNSVSGNTWLNATDATFNAVGDLTIQVNVNGVASITSSGAVVIDGVGASTGDRLNIQAVNGISQGAAGLDFTNFGTLTNTTTGGISLTNSNWMTLNGAINAVGQTVALNVVNGGISQTSSGIITADRLSITATQGAQLGEVNQVAELGVIDVGAHNFVFRTSGDLLIDGDITSGLNVILTSATGGVSQTAGSDITAAGGLTVWAETGINLTNAGNNSTRISGLFNLGSGGIAYGQSNGILIDGTIRAQNQTVSLTSAGAISATNTIFFPQIEAGTLNLSAGGAITLHRDNDVDNLGLVTAGGDFTFNDVDGFNLTGNVNAGALALTAQNGSIVQTGGVITATSLNANATANLDFDRANAVGGGVTLTAGGDAVYRNAGSLNVAGATVTGTLGLYSNTGAISQTAQISAGVLNAGAVTGISLTNNANDFGALGDLSNTGMSDITIHDANGFNLVGDITTGAGSGVVLSARNGGIVQQAGSSITSGVLAMEATTDLILNGDNDIDTLYSSSAGSAFEFNNIGGFELYGTISANTLELTAGGAITQAFGRITAGTLSLTATAATLNGANNDIDNLDRVDVSGNLRFRDNDDFQLTGAITVGGTLSLTSTTDDIVQVAGSVLDVGRLEATSRYDIRLDEAGNSIDQLGDITSTHSNITIIADGAVTIDGDLSAAIGNIYVASTNDDVVMTAASSMTAGATASLRSNSLGDVVVGNVQADELQLFAMGGSVSSTAAPTIVVNRFQAYAPQDIILTGSNLHIKQFGLVSAGDELSILGNNGPLDLNGNLFGKTIALGSTGAITQSSGSMGADVATISAGGALTLNRVLNNLLVVNLNGTDISYTGRTDFAANVITATGAVSLTSIDGEITQTAGTGKIVANSLAASARFGLTFSSSQNDIVTLAGLTTTTGPITYRDMGGFDIAGDITAAGRQVLLISDGSGAGGDDITQSAGIISAGSLTGSSAGDLLFTQANTIGLIGALSAGGDLTYRGAAAVDLRENLTAGGTLNLVSDTGPVMQNGGAITAQTLTGSAAMGLLLSRINYVDAIGAVAVSNGEFTFRNADGFDITGAVQATNGITLQSGGDIIQTTGSLTTSALQAYSSGRIALGGAGNNIASLLAAFAMGDFAYADADGFTIDGNAYSGGVMSLSTGSGSITQVDGILTASRLDASAGSELNLVKANAIQTLGDLSAGDRIYFASADSFSIAGNLNSPLVILATFAGGITQLGGSITAGSLAVDAQGDVLLDSSGNDVDAINYLMVRNGGFSFRDVDSVQLSGSVTVGGVANFNVGGNLTQTAAGRIFAQSVQGSAGGDFDLSTADNEVTQLGEITAANIRFKALDGLTLAGNLSATTAGSPTGTVFLEAGDTIRQTSGVITADTLSAEALTGDLDLNNANEILEIARLRATSGDVTLRNIDSIHLRPTAAGEIRAGGTLSLFADAGDVSQVDYGLTADALIVRAGGYILLSEANDVNALSGLSAGDDAAFVDIDGFDITGDIDAVNLSLTSQGGEITQSAGIITATRLSGFAYSGATFGQANVVDALGDFEVHDGDFLFTNAGDIFVSGTLTAGSQGRVTLTSQTGTISSSGAGRIEGGSLVAAGVGNVILDGDVDSITGLTSTGGSVAWTDDNGFDLAGDVTGDGVTLNANSANIVQTSGVITTGSAGLSVYTHSGSTSLNGANQITHLAYLGGYGSFSLVNDRSFAISGPVAIGGDLSLRTTTGDIVQSGATALNAEGDVAITAAGLLDLKLVGSHDDMTLAGQTVRVAAISLHSDLDADSDGYNLTITGGSGGVRLGAADRASITGDDFLNRSGSAGAVTINSDADVDIHLNYTDARIGFTAAGDARLSLLNNNLNLADVSARSFTMYAVGDIDATSVTVGGGDYIAEARTFTGSALDLGGSARDVSVTAQTNIALNANLIAQRNLTITTGGTLTGAFGVVAGADAIGSGDVSITAYEITLDTVGADGSVTLDAGSTVDVATVIVRDDYNLTGQYFSTGALTPLGATLGTWNLHVTGGSLFNNALVYNGDISIIADGYLEGVGVQSINGGVSINGADDVIFNHILAGEGVLVSAGGALSLGWSTATAGDIDLTGREVMALGLLDASGNVDVEATDGMAVIEAGRSGGNITIASTNGRAQLGAASLTGLTGDLTITASDGVATLGAGNAAGITTDNVFERAAGGVGTVSITGDDGAKVFLHESADIDLVRGALVNVLVENGDLKLGTLEATTDDIFAEAENGSLTVANANAAHGGVNLYATGGGLTITGDVYGDTRIWMETDGLLDGSLANSIASGGSLLAAGGDVLLGTISAGGYLVVEALTGDAYVEQATAGETVQVIAIEGDATLRGASAVDGIAVVADGKATLGADTAAGITNDNSVFNTVSGCLCGPSGITVLSFNGDAVVNLYRADGLFDVIDASATGDAKVVVQQGNLTIADLAGYNIDVKVENGTLETGYGDPSTYGVFTSGGNYRIEAQDFLGNALNPTLSNGVIGDYSVVDTYGQLNLTGLSIAAGGDIFIEAQDGPVTGNAQLRADGDVTVNATVVALDLIDAGGDAFVSASTGGIALGSRIDADGDITLQAQSAVTGNAVLIAGGDLTIDAGGITVDVAQAGNDVTLRSYGNPLTVSTQVMAGRDVLLDAGQSGVLNGGALVSGGRDVQVNASSITLDSVQAARDLNLQAWYGAVDVASGVTIGRNYTLTGPSFSAAALTPLGNRTGNLTLTSNGLGLDYSAGTLTYGGDISITSLYGALVGGAVTSLNGDITIVAQSADVGGLTAESGQIDVQSTTGAGGVRVASARAFDRIYVYGSSGDAVLGSAVLLGTGANSLTVRSVQNGNAYLGATTAGGITAANVFTSAGATTDASVTSAFGSAFVRLHSANAITEITGPVGVGVTVLNGAFSVGSINSTNGDVTVAGPSGGLTVGYFRGNDVTFTGGDITLTSGLAYSDLSIDSTGAIALLGPNTPQTSARIDVIGDLSLAADDGITQSTEAMLLAASLTVDAGDAVKLVGLNAIATIAGVSVLNGGFTYESRQAGGVQITGPMNLAGQTLDLRIFGGPLTQTAGSVITAGRLTGTSAGSVNLNGANQIAQLGDFSVDYGARFFLNVDRGLTIDGLVQAGGGVTIQSDMMVISANGTVRSTASGDAVVLAANGVFMNQSGADAIQADFGRWLVYSQAYNDPSGSTNSDNYGGLDGRSYYGVGYDFDGGGFGGPVGAGNRFVHAYRPVITFTPISKTVTYDGLIPGVTFGVSGVRAHDVGANPYTGAPVLAGNTSKNVGTYLITASLGSLLTDMNYDFAFGTGTLIIDPKVLTGTLTAQNKTYDGTDTAAGLIVLNGVVIGDDVGASAASYTFGDKNAGLAKTVTANGAFLSGGDAGNYVLSPLATALADILRRNINAVVAADDKTYDATTGATGSLTLDGVLAGDDLSITGDLVFDNKNAGANKLVWVANTLISGADAGNYEVSVGTGVADIARKVLTGGFTANSKTYDGTTTASGTLTVTGFITGDDVAANATYSFGDKNAGAGKTVTANASLSGADAGNYEFGPLGTALADILRKTVTVAITVNNKTYDGSTSTSGSMTVSGILAGDDASVAAGTYNFADANAGTGKTVTIAGVTLTGSGSGNYQLAGVPSTLLADILRRQVSVQADDHTKLFGQLDPLFTYRITAGSLVSGDGFTGGLVREPGDVFGSYAIGQGTLSLGSNYELLFTPGQLDIRPVPGGGQDGSTAFQYLREPQPFSLRWNPTENFTFDHSPVCLSLTGCGAE